MMAHNRRRWARLLRESPGRPLPPRRLLGGRSLWLLAGLLGAAPASGSPPDSFFLESLVGVARDGKIFIAARSYPEADDNGRLSVSIYTSGSLVALYTRTSFTSEDDHTRWTGRGERSILERLPPCTLGTASLRGVRRRFIREFSLTPVRRSRLGVFTRGSGGVLTVGIKGHGRAFTIQHDMYKAPRRLRLFEHPATKILFLQATTRSRGLYATDRRELAWLHPAQLRAHRLVVRGNRSLERGRLRAAKNLFTEAAALDPAFIPAQRGLKRSRGTATSAHPGTSTDPLEGSTARADSWISLSGYPPSEPQGELAVIPRKDQEKLATFCKFIFSKIFFDPGSTEIKGQQLSALKLNARALLTPRCALGVRSFKLVGHGAKHEEDAAALALARVEAVRRALVSMGVSEARVKVTASRSPTPADPDFKFDPSQPLRRGVRIYPEYGRVDFMVKSSQLP